MKQKKQLLFIIILLIGYNISIFAQQNKMKTGGNKNLISIDSIKNISINNIIYYSKPLEFKYFSITDTTYIPVWYKSFCANYNIDFFDNYPKEAIHYISNDLGLNESILKYKFDKVINLGGMQEHYKKNPERKFLYIYDEIWITAIKSNTKYLLVYGFYSDKQMDEISLSNILTEKNTKNEVLDTIKNLIISTSIFVEENDTLKWCDQINNFENIILDNNYNINPYLNTFKDMVYRKSKYIQSEMENGKRIFKTMEKNGKTFKVKKVSNKPEQY